MATKFKMNVERTLNAFTSGTYEVVEALYEFADNSEAADATEIYIGALRGSTQPLDTIIFYDNGNGMTREELLAAMEFAGEIRQRSIHEVSEFGVGLKAAAFSLANRFAVITRDEEGSVCGSFLERGRINKCQEYDGPFDQGTDERALKLWNKHSQYPESSGTVIILEELIQTEYQDCKTFIGKEKAGIRHLGKLATRYCDKIKSGSLKIFTVNGNKGAPNPINFNDPLSRDEDLGENYIMRTATQQWKKTGASFNVTATRMPEGSSNDFGIYLKVNGITIYKDRDTLFGMFKEGASHSYRWHLRAEIEFTNKDEFNKVFEFTSHKHDVKLKDPAFGDWLRDSQLGKLFIAEAARRKAASDTEKAIKSQQARMEASMKFAEIFRTDKNIFGSSKTLRSRFFGKVKAIEAGKFETSDEISRYDDEQEIIYYNNSNYFISSLMNSDKDSKNHEARTLAAVNALVNHAQLDGKTLIPFEESNRLTANLLYKAA